MPRKKGRYKPSRRYRELASKVEKGKAYSIEDAITILKSGKKLKFDESVDLALKLGLGKAPADAEAGVVHQQRQVSQLGKPCCHLLNVPDY